MKLVVGLGNPGTEYERTRHNVGFMFIDNYLGEVKFDTKFNGLFYTENINNDKVIFLKPQSYMNLSGTVVKRFCDYYKISPADILIIRDDLDMPLGQVRIKDKSSSGGDNGIKNIIEEINSMEFTQLKIGIASDKLFDKKSFVLGKFSEEEYEIVMSSINTTRNIVNDFRVLSINDLKNKYNSRSSK